MGDTTSRLTDRSFLLGSQYADPTALEARIRIHSYGTNSCPWPVWVFDHLDLPPDCRILELGCGTGGFWKANASRIPVGWDVTLTDFSPGMLDAARANLSALDRSFGFQVADAQDIPFDDGSFDAVIAMALLYHVPDRPKALSEIRRVLRHDGVFYATANGRGAMKEMAEFARGVGLELAVGCEAEEFGLENGREQLAPFFSGVDVITYDDALIVPQAKPVVDWILSCVSSASSASNEQELTAAVEEELRRAGSVHITKSLGLFRCSGSSRAQ